MNQFSGRKAFRDELLDYVDAGPGRESKADQAAIWKRFISLCRAGDAWAVKLWIERRWPTREANADSLPTVIIKDFTGLSPAEKAALANVPKLPSARGPVLDLEPRRDPEPVLQALEDAPGSTNANSEVKETGADVYEWLPELPRRRATKAVM